MPARTSVAILLYGFSNNRLVIFRCKQGHNCRCAIDRTTSLAQNIYSLESSASADEFGQTSPGDKTSTLQSYTAHPTEKRPFPHISKMHGTSSGPPEPASQLYTIAADPDVYFSSVKAEPTEDGFIQDVSHQFGLSQPQPFEHLVPPTEVPLRATGASKEMRKLMSVFRLNPFSMHHDGGRGVSDPLWNGEEAGPLTAEPRYIDFQLNGGYDTEKSEYRSDSGSPHLQIRILEDDDGTPSPWTASDDGTHSSGWQASEWSSDEGRSLTAHGNACLDLEYTGALACKQFYSFKRIMLKFLL